jgi:hypothetical protein
MITAKASALLYALSQQHERVATGEDRKEADVLRLEDWVEEDWRRVTQCPASFIGFFGVISEASSVAVTVYGVRISRAPRALS